MECADYRAPDKARHCKKYVRHSQELPHRCMKPASTTSAMNRETDNYKGWQERRETRGITKDSAEELQLLPEPLQCSIMSRNSSRVPLDFWLPISIFTLAIWLACVRCAAAQQLTLPENPTVSEPWAHSAVSV